MKSGSRKTSGASGHSGREKSASRMGSRRNQRMVRGVQRELEACRDTQLVEDVRQMVLDGLLAQCEARGDVLVRRALGHFPDDVQFAARQACARRHHVRRPGGVAEDAHEIRDALAGFRELAYTSVMTVLNIMTRKGYLKRSRAEGGYVYRARISERSTSRRMLSDLVDRVFEGSAAAVMLNLLESGQIDRNELQQLRDLINKRSQER